nr:mucin-5AC-like isoform X2 [Geotrypetes seraphini]
MMERAVEKFTCLFILVICYPSNFTAEEAIQTCSDRVCNWSKWYNVYTPSKRPDDGDFETLDNIRAQGHKVCRSPRDVLCRSVKFPYVPTQHMYYHIKCSVSIGLTCYNKDQHSQWCLDYKIKVLCCSCDTVKPTSITSGPDLISPNTKSSVEQVPSQTFCNKTDCKWSQWYNVHTPSHRLDDGDFETFENIRSSGYDTCRFPSQVQCKLMRFSYIPLKETYDKVECSVKDGLKCYNRDLWPNRCLDYKIKFLCCSCDSSITSDILPVISVSDSTIVPVSTLQSTGITQTNQSPETSQSIGQFRQPFRASTSPAKTNFLLITSQNNQSMTPVPTAQMVQPSTIRIPIVVSRQSTTSTTNAVNNQSFTAPTVETTESSQSSTVPPTISKMSKSLRIPAFTAKINQSTAPVSIAETGEWPIFSNTVDENSQSLLDIESNPILIIPLNSMQTDELVTLTNFINQIMNSISFPSTTAEINQSKAPTSIASSQTSISTDKTSQLLSTSAITGETRQLSKALGSTNQVSHPSTFQATTKIKQSSTTFITRKQENTFLTEENIHEATNVFSSTQTIKLLTSENDHALTNSTATSKNSQRLTAPISSTETNNLHTNLQNSKTSPMTTDKSSQLPMIPSTNIQTNQLSTEPHTIIKTRYPFTTSTTISETNPSSTVLTTSASTNLFTDPTTSATNGQSSTVQTNDKTTQSLISMDIGIISPVLTATTSDIQTQTIASNISINLVSMTVQPIVLDENQSTVTPTTDAAIPSAANTKHIHIPRTSGIYAASMQTPPSTTNTVKKQSAAPMNYEIKQSNAPVSQPSIIPAVYATTTPLSTIRTSHVTTSPNTNAAISQSATPNMPVQISQSAASATNVNATATNVPLYTSRATTSVSQPSIIPAVNASTMLLPTILIGYITSVPTAFTTMYATASQSTTLVPIVPISQLISPASTLISSSDIPTLDATDSQSSTMPTAKAKSPTLYAITQSTSSNTDADINQSRTDPTMIIQISQSAAPATNVNATTSQPGVPLFSDTANQSMDMTSITARQSIPTIVASNQSTASVSIPNATINQSPTSTINTPSKQSETITSINAATTQSSDFKNADVATIQSNILVNNSSADQFLTTQMTIHTTFPKIPITNISTSQSRVPRANNITVQLYTTPTTTSIQSLTVNAVTTQSATVQIANNITTQSTIPVPVAGTSQSKAPIIIANTRELTTGQTMSGTSKSTAPATSGIMMTSQVVPRANATVQSPVTPTANVITRQSTATVLNSQPTAVIAIVDTSQSTTPTDIAITSQLSTVPIADVKNNQIVSIADIATSQPSTVQMTIDNVKSIALIPADNDIITGSSSAPEDNCN